MTTLQKLGDANRDFERGGYVRDFMTGLKYLMLNPRGGGELVAKKERAPDRTIDFIKAAVLPGGTYSGSWGEPLAQFNNLPQAFLNSLQGVSVFDTLLPNMLVVPPFTSVVVTGAC